MHQGHQVSQQFGIGPRQHTMAQVEDMPAGAGVECPAAVVDHSACRLLDSRPPRQQCDGIKVEKGDILHFVTWGGGGWGDPLERETDLIGLEITRGLVTVEGALAYGVVAHADGSIDEAATEALRAKMRSERGPLQLFDRGPSIDELRASCLADTGLAAPVKPVWRNRPVKMAAE